MPVYTLYALTPIQNEFSYNQLAAESRLQPALTPIQNEFSYN